MYNEANLVATLENVEYMVDDRKYREKTMPRSLGTGGSIYRVKAIRQIGGFDPNIRRAGEDTDAEHRISEAGWLLCRTQAVFSEIRRETWKAVWEEYFWRGYGGYYVAHKNSASALSSLHRIFPPAAILDEVLLSFDAYRLTHRKAVFLLPLHWTFKRIAWCLGFAKSYMEGHRHA